MSGEQSAAELFADDLMKIVAERLQIEARQMGEVLQIVLKDNHTGLDICSTLFAVHPIKDRFKDKDGRTREYVEHVSLRPDW